MKTETELTGTELYSHLLKKYGDNFQRSSPSFGDLLWQLLINEVWKDQKPHCFIATYDKNGLVLGIAEQDERGYYNSHVYFNNEMSYDKATDLLTQINTELFGMLPKATGNIVLSSMRVS